jgi:hypothetical protein
MGCRDDISYTIEAARSGEAGQRHQAARAFWGMQRTLVTTWSPASPRASPRCWKSPASAIVPRRRASNLKLQLGYSHDVDFAVPEGHRPSRPRTRPRSRSADRQAEGRPGCRRDPPLAQARALQGQGHQVSRRVYLPQGREEEVMAKLSLFERRRRRVRTALARAGGRPRLSVHRSGSTSTRRSSTMRQGRTVAAASTLEQGCARRQCRCRCQGRQAHRRAPPRRPASPPSCSIAAGSCSMAASRRWPMPPAKAGWSSDDG